MRKTITASELWDFIAPIGADGAFTGQEMVDILDTLEPGTPIMLDCGTGSYEQVIYLGIDEVQYQKAYKFYDGSGLTGSFGETKRFILENPGTVSMMLNSNNPNEVSKLLKSVKGSKTTKRRFTVDASKGIKAASYHRWGASCIDPETGMEIILSDVSYNQAMSFLMSEGFTEYDTLKTIDIYRTELVFSKPTHRTFLYDEERGLLLGD